MGLWVYWVLWDELMGSFRLGLLKFKFMGELGMVLVPTGHNLDSTKKKALFGSR